MNDKNDSIATELRQMAKGTGISALGRLSLQLLQLALGYVFAHTLKTEKLALYSLSNNVVRLAERTASLGLHAGGLRYVSIYLGQGKPAKVKGVILAAILLSGGLGLLAVIALVLSAQTISTQVFHNTDLGPILRIMVLAIPLFALFRIVTQVSAARRTITPQVVGSLVYQGLLLGLFGLLWWRGLDTWAVVWAYLGAAMVSLVVGCKFLFSLFPVLFDRHVRPVYQIKELVAFSLPLLMTDLATFGATRFDIFLVGIWLTAREVGIYHIVHVMAFFGGFGLAQVAAVFRPIIADLHSRGELEKLGDIFKVATRWGVAISIPICLFIMVKPQALLGIFGEEFLAGQVAVVILTGAHIVSAGVGNVGWMLIMSGHSWLALANNLVSTVINIGLAYLLIHPYGIVGVAIATAVALSLVNLARLVEVRIILGLSPYDLNILKPCTAALIAAGLIFLIPLGGLLGLGVSLVAYVFVYLAVLYALGLSEADRLVLRRVARFAGINRPTENLKP